MASQRRNGGGNGGDSRGSPPVHSVKYWTGSGQIELATFANKDGNGRVQYSTVVKKTYKAGDEYRDSNSLFHEELPILAAALINLHKVVQDLKDEQST